MSPVWPKPAALQGQDQLPWYLGPTKASQLQSWKGGSCRCAEPEYSQPPNWKCQAALPRNTPHALHSAQPHHGERTRHLHIITWGGGAGRGGCCHQLSFLLFSVLFILHPHSVCLVGSSWIPLFCCSGLEAPVQENHVLLMWVATIWWEHVWPGHLPWLDLQISRLPSLLSSSNQVGF